MSATPGCCLVARKGLQRTNQGLIINESYGFAMDSRLNGLDGPNESSGFADHGFAMDSMDSE